MSGASSSGQQVEPASILNDGSDYTGGASEDDGSSMGYSDFSKLTDTKLHVANVDTQFSNFGNMAPRSTGILGSI